MFKIKDRITLNEHYKNFIGYGVIREVLSTTIIEKEQYYILKRLSDPGSGLVFELTCKYVNKNYVTILCQEK
jgi:hypothetical protein|tara:strand:- start:289 stop:504 length:216 start_codon:yes stop_codon:yes gene_type:complete